MSETSGDSKTRLELWSWGRVSHGEHIVYAPAWPPTSLPDSEERGILPHGLGRSYGDSCLNVGGAAIVTKYLDRIAHFDQATGILRCEAGISLVDVLRFAVPRGFFLPTTPGSKFVTIGGAIANDVHGKNHGHAGTFGCHVKKIGLLRSDHAAPIECSPTANAELFAATIGGLGLTGLILWAEVQLAPIKSAFVDEETIKFGNLNEYYAISEESEDAFEFTMAWADCVAQGSELGRGHYIRGNFSDRADLGSEVPGPKLPIPVDFPPQALSAMTMKLFNKLYYNRLRSRETKRTRHYDGFFYPLDVLSDWNRIYGKRGFFQYQFVVGPDQRDVVQEIFKEIAATGLGSFLAVLKTFGDKQSPGMLSFPRPGYTLALDFANTGDDVQRLFTRLDELVASAKGALYPAKDGRMSAEMMRLSFPQLDQFKQHVDPRFSSDFWRRVSDG